ncbi:two-component system capsular synthesis sensor histidine kinase RcsC [Pseudomonas sp. 2848]|uniref:hybrid sensor histidine kinase/response regulator n=1 Tax=Pseudomonas sp. 2848 TaxID=2183926 RepID=UPI000DAF2A6F|nr:hybrid sensor histidine kinase/response regulator [Pseudomonas sp. 2848]PZW79249.1 two-component system capsular synthesis sensor histidine kinase RcsC [Pseudomonas sp. 2848]
MKKYNALLDNLARSSLRLNKGMTALLGLALLLIAFGIWSLQRLVDEHNDTVNIHFARLMENIREQEYFLRTLVRQSVEGQLLERHRPLDAALTPLPEEGQGIFQGQAFPFTLPFSVKLDSERVNSSEMPLIFSQGANLAAFYSSFWSAAHYRSPQVFLFSPSMHYDIAVPAAGRGRGQTISGNEPFLEVVEQVATRMPEESAWSQDDSVIWRSYVPHPDHASPARLLAYASVPSNPTRAGAGRFQIASLVDLAQINDFERIMAWTVYDRFTLITPSGRVLIGDALPLADLHEGLNFKANGLVFHLNEHASGGWSAVYTVTYQHFFRYAFWSLVSLAVIFLVIFGLGRLAIRWYQWRVIIPARAAHATITESEAFSRVVIDTAPTGLCVVRNADHTLLLENQCAQQWDSTGELIKTLAPQLDNICSGEDHVRIDGRHFKVGFVSTRYQGEDVKLLAFNDVTHHIQDAQALEDARRAADAANQAKTLFLATMSHEIRTPLYGVLGTLELLGLTQLDSRQQGYLHTIQRSSATLFQLISDVLDVSKIESGQMALEPVAFCPLDMLEDTLRTYCAFAERKGLLLYACTDARLPAQIVGDPIRIRQILNNLLSNAIKFTDTGRVVLRTRVLAIDAAQVSLEWQVTDSGIGISEAQQARLFELFYQVMDATSEGGAGLGLPICGWLADMMGGQIKVVSEPGLGSSFSLKVSLPLAHGELGDCPSLAPEPTPVYVRAPIPELAQHCVDWLQRLGIAATLTIPSQEQDNAQALVVDMLDCTNAEPWQGQRICASSDGPVPGEFKNDRWHVNMHDVRAIARVIGQVRLGDTTENHVITQQQHAALSLHVLVAEDNPINQAILKEQLEALGCSTVVAANGEQAMQQWQPGLFDVVLTDVNMPLMNGYELARTLRQLDTQISIIGVTANALREEGQRCLEMGMNAWMVKPLSLHALRTHLVRLCRPASLNLNVNVGDEHKPLSAPTPADTVQLSPAMRTLFVSTMQDDMNHLLQALEQRNSQRLVERLHSISGALGAVQARALAEQCLALENALLGAPIDASLVERVDEVLARLTAILASLE